MVFNSNGATTLGYMTGERVIKLNRARNPLLNSYYFALRCKACGGWRAKETKNVSTARFKCFFCNKEVKLRIASAYGFNVDYKRLGSMKEATLFVSHKNGVRTE